MKIVTVTKKNIPAEQAHQKPSWLPGFAKSLRQYCWSVNCSFIAGAAHTKAMLATATALTVSLLPTAHNKEKKNCTLETALRPSLMKGPILKCAYWPQHLIKLAGIKGWKHSYFHGHSFYLAAVKISELPRRRQTGFIWKSYFKDQIPPKRKKNILVTKIMWVHDTSKIQDNSHTGWETQDDNQYRTPRQKSPSQSASFSLTYKY